MRVLLDATAIPADRGGVGRYVEGLVQGLEQIGAGPSLAVVAQARDAATFGSLAPSAEVIPAPAVVGHAPTRLVWEQSGLPLLRRRLSASIVHSPHYTYPLAAGCPVVVTLHDATFFTLPAVHLAAKRRFFRAWTRRSVLHAEGLITVSAATRNELLRLVGGDPATFTVAHLGVDSDTFRPPTRHEISAFRERAGIPERPWIAFLGTLEPRKNVAALIRAYARAFVDDPSPPVLLLAGSQGWDPALLSTIAGVPAPLSVHRLGYLPRNLLAAFLGGAVLVAYPSLGEGFGLPVLEAMACGAPVLTSRRLSLPEVGGEAVEYVDVSADSIADGLRRLYGDAGQRQRLSSAASARASTFTWSRCAAMHIEAYQRATRSVL